MKRSGPLRRNTPLRSAGSLKRSGVSGRSGRVRRSRSDLGPSEETRAAVIARDGGCRAVRLVPELACGMGWHVHHVLPRSAGGGHDESNLLLLCGAHHGWVHGNPAASYALGLLARKSSRKD